jgi:bacteriorhodopsin
MKNRRHQNADKLLLFLRIAASLGWFAIIGVQIIVWLAAPEFDTGIVRYHELELRDHWQEYWVQWLPLALGACALLSLLALGVSPFRSRRKTDPKRIHLLVLLALTLIGYAVYWFQILNNVG